MKKIILLLFLLTGCYKPPMYNDYIKVVDTPFLKNINDSSNRCAKYARILHENGYEVYFYIRQYEDGSYGHCLVYVPDSKVKYIDPLCYDWGKKIGRDMGKHKMVLIPYSDKDLYNDLFKEYSP